jgi:hypothetical protein
MSTKKKAVYSKKLEFGSPEYVEWFDSMKNRKGPQGLSLCCNDWILLNPYWKEKHAKQFKNCQIKHPKDWLEEESFIAIAKEFEKIEKNLITRPLEYNERDEDEEENVIYLRSKS